MNKENSEKLNKQNWNELIEGKLLVHCPSIDETIKLVQLLEQRTILVWQPIKSIWEQYKDKTCFGYSDTRLFNRFLDATIIDRIKVISYSDLYYPTDMTLDEAEKPSDSEKEQIDDNIPIIEEEVVTVKRTLNKNFFEKGKFVIMQLKNEKNFYDSGDFSVTFKSDIADNIKKSPDNKIRGRILDIQDDTLICLLNDVPLKTNIPLLFLSIWITHIEVV